MTLTSATVLLVALCNAALGAVVFRKAPRRPGNRWFGLLALSVTFWSLGLAVLYSTPDYSIAGRLATGRFTFSAASLLPYFFLGFTKYFAIESPLPSRTHLRLLAIPAMALFAISFSPWMVSQVVLSDGRLHTEYGPLYPLFAVYFLACLSITFLVLYQKLRQTTGRTRLQIKYLYLGIVLALAGATTTNLLIPLLFHSSSFAGYGPLFLCMLLAFATHSIVRYRLMDIRVVVRSGLAYFLSVALAACAFISLLMTVATFFRTGPNDVPLGLQLALALLIALAFHPLKQFIQIHLNRYVYRATYDYQHTLRHATQKIGTMLEPASLMGFLCDLTLKTVQPEAVHLYLRRPDRYLYQLESTHQRLDVPNCDVSLQLLGTSPIVELLRNTKRPLSLDDELPEDIADSVQQHLSNLNIALALPLCVDEDLIALILVGPKLSGDPFFPSDIDLLSTLGGQASIALRNAQLYSEVLLANNHVENLLATIDSGVIAVNRAGAVTLFNSAAEKLTGQSALSVVGRAVESLGEPISSRLRLTLSVADQTLQEETILIDPSGRLVPVVCSASQLRGTAGDVLGSVMIISEITHLKELDAAKRRAERLGSFGALASGIAHEIKNPLVAIRTFAELLPERYAEEDFREGFAQLVVNEITRIDDLVARLRDLAAPTRPTLAPVDLREPLAETLSLLRAQLDQKKITANIDYVATRFLVPGDPAQLKQLFLNLCLNAIDAMDINGTLTLRLIQRTAGGSATLLVEVIDTGCGISGSLLDRIFDPFVTSKPRGSGLGLAICRGIMDAHGASITAANNVPEPGATIRLEFPATLPADVTFTVNN